MSACWRDERERSGEERMHACSAGGDSSNSKAQIADCRRVKYGFCWDFAFLPSWLQSRTTVLK